MLLDTSFRHIAIDQMQDRLSKWAMIELPPDPKARVVEQPESDSSVEFVRPDSSVTR